MLFIGIARTKSRADVKSFGRAFQSSDEREHQGDTTQHGFAFKRKRIRLFSFSNLMAFPLPLTSRKTELKRI